jgi:hypothetical protein
MVALQSSKRHYEGLIRIKRKDTLVKIIRHWIILIFLSKKREEWLTSKQIMELLKILLRGAEEVFKMMGLSSKRTLERDLAELSGRKGGRMKILEYKRLKRNEYCYRIYPSILEKFFFDVLILRVDKKHVSMYPFSIFQLFYLIRTLHESNNIYEWMREYLRIPGKILEAGFLLRRDLEKEYFETALLFLTKEVYERYRLNFFKLILTNPPKKEGFFKYIFMKIPPEKWPATKESIKEEHSKTTFDNYFLERLKKYFKISYIIDKKGGISLDELLKYAKMKKETVKKILVELQIFNFVKIEYNDKGEIEKVRTTIEGHNFCWYLLSSFAEKIIKTKKELDKYLNLE